MSRFRGVRGTLAVLAVVAAAMVVGVPSAVADLGVHGISFAKGCDSPTNIGQPYSCSYLINNTADTLHDTLSINGLSDQVHSAGGDVNSGPILSALQLVFSDPSVSCVGGSGAGTVASPYVGATSCLLPFNTSITTNPHSFYTVQPGDFNLPGNSLTDTASLQWNDTCDKSNLTPPPRNCTTGAQSASAGSSSEIDKLPSVTSTQIHNAAHQPVLVVQAGSTVHDFVTLTGTAGQPAPSGNVSFSFFGSNTCSGPPLAGPSSQGPLVDQGGGISTLDATGFAQGPLTAGLYGFQASYGGDGIYLPSTGACEPLRVVDANIQLTPATATNHVGTPHTLTCHINVNDGSGQVNAPDGTTCTVTIVSGPGTPASQNCTTGNPTPGSGSCDVVINSAITGMSTLQASTNVTVGGLTLQRQTGDAHPGDGPNAQKLWVNAAISIAPNATNEINHPHTFTATLFFDTGSGLVPAGAGQTVTVTLTGSNGANPNPAGPFTLATNAAGQVSVTFTSATPGKVTGNASWTGSVSGSNTFTVSTDGTGANSGPATKTFVDANIQITPATAVNPVGTNHTLHCHININDGSGAGYVNAPAGTVCTVNITAGPGTPATQNCTIVSGGTCDVVITSSTAGTSTIQATTMVTVGGVVLSRTTGDANVGDGPNAQKQWVKAKIVIAPNATNEINHPHTFTATVSQDTGSGYQTVGAGVPVTLTLTGSNGATPNPAGPFNLTTNASGQVSVTFTSATPGKVNGHACATLTVGGQQLQVCTDGSGDNSNDAVKTFVDANIQITPASAVNPVGTNHTLHCHINVNDGSGAGYVSAPAGTVCTVNITGGPGTPATQNCTIVSGGTCDVVITSATTGTSTIQATTTVTVGGVVLTRTTGDANVGDGPNAQKQWVAARISIAPNATNEVGHPHTFTVTLEKDTGSGFGPAAGEHVDVTLTDSNGAAHSVPTGSCTNAGANTDANGQCTITFTSNSAGKVTGTATSTLTVGGQPLTVSTNGVAPNSGPAVKTFVDANIQITPATAINPVGSNHTLHCHINVNDGSGAGFVNAPAGTVCTVNITAGPGTPATQNCSTVGTTGTCDAVITSSTTGTSTIQASTTVTVGGVVLTRTTGDTNAGDGPNASKNWADDTVVTHVRDAANNDITGTTVPAGTVVHDTATVAKAAGTPAGVPDPSGTVTFTLYDNGTCNGNLLQTDPNEALSGGTATSVTFTTPSGSSGSFSYRAHYNGDANYPAHDAACEPFNTQGTPQGQITPTNTSCSDFTSGTAQTLGQVNYSVSGGKIGQGINPGVFFFYSTIKTTTPNQVVTITQSNNSTNNAALFGILNGQAWLWTGDCTSKIVGTTTGSNDSGASFTVATPGTYVISLKYQTKSIAGTTAPIPANITYTWTTSLGGQTGASVLLKKQ